MEPALHFICALSSALFCGAAIYISLVEHPARMSCGVEVAAAEFAPSYRRAVPMQVSLALIATITALASWWFSDNWCWLIGALLIFSVIPFTVLVIAPTNKQLLAPGLDKNAPGTKVLLDRWGRLHGVRSVASLAAALLFLALAIGAG